MKKSLLYLVHRLPYPPNKGDKIPSFNMLKFFSKEYDIYLGTFIDLPEDWQYVDKVNEYCRDTCVVGLNPKAAKVKSLSGLVTGKALSLPYYYSATMQRWVDSILETVQPDALLIFSGVMAQFVSGKWPAHKPSLLDFIDVDSDKWRLYAERHRWPMSWVYRRESQRLLAYERAMAAEFASCLFVSEKEARYFQTLAPEVADKVHFRVQGVDSIFFDPAIDAESPYRDTEKVMVFVGAMDYWPNIDAAVWFATEIFPKIKEKCPEAAFAIVGMNPTEPVRQLAERDGVMVTGSVDDIRPYMKHAHFSVAPLRIARGIQNKVLEALSMGKQVVATENALTGIEYSGDELQQAMNEEDFVAKSLCLLNEERLQNKAGRDLVLSGYNWESSLVKVRGLLEEK